jgi:hypothetical protein
MGVSIGVAKVGRESTKAFPAYFLPFCGHGTCIEVSLRDKHIGEREDESMCFYRPCVGSALHKMNRFPVRNDLLAQFLLHMEGFAC